jgi:GNAT superfamily N-acetyltransferase
MPIREFNPQTDYPRLAALYASIEAFDQTGTVDVSEAAIRQEPVDQRWVMETAEGLLAYSDIAAQSPTRFFMNVAVDPQSRRQGIGSSLLKHGLAYARTQGARQVVVVILESNTRATAFLRSSGFEIKGHNRFMSLAVPPSVPIEWPDGFSVRSMAEIGDWEVMAEACNLCYSDHWGHYENSTVLTTEKLKEWADQYAGSLLIPAGISIVFAPDGRIAGLSSGRLLDGGRRKVVDAPGIAPEFRHFALLRPLILQTIQWLNSAPYELHTYGDSDEETQVALDLGFVLEDRNHWVEYGLDLEEI